MFFFNLLGETFSRDRESFLPRLEFSTTQLVSFLLRLLYTIKISVTTVCILHGKVLKDLYEMLEGNDNDF